jgi:hypothetical protein
VKQGLTDKEIKGFLDLLLKANNEQIGLMLESIKGEIFKRRLKGFLR